MQCIILGDNEQGIRTANVQSHVMASRSLHGTWVKAYSSLQAQMPTFVSTQFAWIKEHAGFQGNECSDLFSKWIAYSSSSSPELLPPPPLGTVSFGSLPVCHHLTTSVSRALIPRHHHYNIHVPPSIFFYNHSSWFSGLPFKWSSGNMNFLTYAFHNDLTPQICNKCSQSHRLDVASFLSHCPSADHIVRSFMHAWPPPFNQVASIWWAQCSHPGDKQNFVKLLVPSTLYVAMTTPTTGETKPLRVFAFQNALPQRQQQLKDALSKALTWLTEDPPPLPHPPPPRTQHLGQTIQHLQHVAHPTGAQRLPLPPTSRPPARLSPTPPPSKKIRTNKKKKPMRPKQPPTKRSRDTADSPPRKTRSDTYAPKPVAPPQPPGADSSDRRITDFFRAPAPPPASGRAAPISEFNNIVFFTPPHRLPYPPSAIGLYSAKNRVNPVLFLSVSDLLQHLSKPRLISSTSHVSPRLTPQHSHPSPRS